MKHILILIFRVTLMVIALYALSNALKEFLIQEDDPVEATLLVLFNVLIAAVCWSFACWQPARLKRGLRVMAGKPTR